MYLLGGGHLKLVTVHMLAILFFVKTQTMLTPYGKA